MIPPVCRVYIVQCADGSLYTGFSTDPVARCAKHNAGKGAKYTRGRGPCSLVWVSVELPHVASALCLERQIKKLTRQAKLKLVQGTLPDATLLAFKDKAFAVSPLQVG